LSEKLSLNKKEKEELVVKLHQENKTLRQIAEIVHMSFKDISSIIKRIDEQADDIGTNLSNKSKASQALYMFNNGKKPIDVAIELDLPESEVCDLQQEFWALHQLYDLPLVYQQLKNDFDLFFELFKLLKKNKMLSKQHILKILRYAGHELPSLESKMRKLTNDIIELEFRKKDLDNTIMLQRAQLSDLGQVITKYQNVIDNKKLR
jgi:hypothetical protein